MAQIKSALEIALERTKSVEIDKNAIEAAELRQAGKKLAGDYLKDPEAVDLAAALGKFGGDKAEPVRGGAFEVFASRLQLPVSRNADPEASFQPVADGLAALGAPREAKAVTDMVAQVAAFMKRYADDITRLDAQLRKQYEPKLKQKEQAYAARTGQAVRIDPMSDPEFVSFYQANAGKLKAQYQAALDEAKAELAKTLGIALPSEE